MTLRVIGASLIITLASVLVVYIIYLNVVFWEMHNDIQKLVKKGFKNEKK